MVGRGVQLPRPQGPRHSDAEEPRQARSCSSAAAASRPPGARPGSGCRSCLPRTSRAPGVLQEQCAEHGTTGFIIMPPEETPLTLARRGPGQGVGRARRAPAARGEAVPELADRRHPLRGVLASASTVEELRAEGIYRICIPTRRSSGASSTATSPRWCCTRCAAAYRSTAPGTRCKLYIDKVLPAL